MKERFYIFLLVIVYIGVLISAIFVCSVFDDVHSKGVKYANVEKGFKVKDNDLLTPEQQRMLVRDGYVYLNDGTMIVNSLENIVYLNEGGLERGIK